MAKAPVRILVVDDFEPWCRFASSALMKSGLEVIGVASDGWAAVQSAQETHPDLVLLDIGLPTLNGLEAARRIREVSPESRVLFVTQETSADMVEEAFATGACGYVAKTDAGSELLGAVETVLRGERYVSRRFAALGYPGSIPVAPGNSRKTGHVVHFHNEDSHLLLENLSNVFRDALQAGESVAAVMRRPHQVEIEKRLQASGVGVREVTASGRLGILSTDVALSAFMEGGKPNRERFLALLEAAIRQAEAAALVKNSRVVVYGDMGSVLCEQGNYAAAVFIEGIGNELARNHSLYICCSYPVSAFPEQGYGTPYAAICTEHSAVVGAF